MFEKGFVQCSHAQGFFFDRNLYICFQEAGSCVRVGAIFATQSIIPHGVVWSNMWRQSSKQTLPMLDCYSAAPSSVLRTGMNGTEKRHAVRVSPAWNNFDALLS